MTMKDWHNERCATCAKFKRAKGMASGLCPIPKQQHNGVTLNPLTPRITYQNNKACSHWEERHG